MPYGRKSLDYEPVTRSRRKPLPGSENDIAADWPSRPKDSTDSAALQNDGTDLPPAPAPSPVPQQEKLALKRGHGATYVALFLYITFVYFRPYELSPSLAPLILVPYVLAIITLGIFIPTQLGLEGTLTARPREVNLVLLLCVIALLSMIFANSPGAAWDEFNKVFMKAVLMFIVMVNVVRTEGRLRGLILLAMAVGCFISFDAFNKYRLGQFDPYDEIGRVVGNIGGMFGNQNDMSLHLVTMIPIAIALFVGTRNPFKKLLYGGCAFLMMAGNFVTFSRGGFLGLIGGGSVLAWKLGRRNRVTILALLIIVGTVSVLLAPGGYGSRMKGIVGAADASASTRTQLLYGSVLVALRHPLFGVGMGNSSSLLVRGQVSHNAYTHIAAEMGLIALEIYVIFMLVSFRRLRQIERETFKARRASRFYYLAVGLQASLICYMISSFFLSVAYQWNVYFLVGYATCLYRLYETSPDVLVEVKKNAGDETAKPEAIDRHRFDITLPET